MITSLEQYIAAQSFDAQKWLVEFSSYMKEKYSQLSPIMFRQCPMYKVGKSYVMFTCASSRFSLHTLNFELISAFQKEHPNSGKGKGCISIPFENREVIPEMKALLDEVVRLNTLDLPPAAGMVPELSYEENIAKMFAREYLKWQPLYFSLLSRAKSSLPDFYEYFPHSNVLWKHTSTFSGVKCRKNCLQIEFFSDRLHEDRNPVSYLKTSANRVSHIVEIEDESGLDNVLDWINESYLLTFKAKKIK